MNPTVELRFTLTEAETVRTLRSATLRHPFLIGLTTFIALNGVLFLVGGRYGMAFGGLAGLALFYLFYLILMSPQRTYDRMSRSLRETSVYYRFSPNGIEARGESFETKMEWKLFPRSEELKDCFLLYQQPGGNYVLLPKRAFRSPEDLEALLNLLKSNTRFRQ